MILFVVESEPYFVLVILIMNNLQTEYRRHVMYIIQKHFTLMDLESVFKRLTYIHKYVLFFFIMCNMFNEYLG